MKRIKFPEGAPVEGVALTCADVIKQFVLVTPFWKAEANLDVIEANLAIEDEMNRNPTTPLISDDDHTILVNSMKLQNGAVQVQDPKMNRLYMITFKAVLRAEKEKESKPEG